MRISLPTSCRGLHLLLGCTPVITPTYLKYVNTSGSVGSSGWLASSGTSTGHCAAAEVFTLVNVMPYDNQRVAESFTSKGGAMPFLFSPTGVTLVTPAIRQKPNIASIDGTNTTFFGSEYEVDNFPNFFGTSAAAPHATAVAALLRSSEPALTPTQVYGHPVPLRRRGRRAGHRQRLAHCGNN